jgi:hypothetical protein
MEPQRRFAMLRARRCERNSISRIGNSDQTRIARPTNDRSGLPRTCDEHTSAPPVESVETSRRPREPAISWKWPIGVSGGPFRCHGKQSPARAARRGHLRERVRTKKIFQDPGPPRACPREPGQKGERSRAVQARAGRDTDGDTPEVRPVRALGTIGFASFELMATPPLRKMSRPSRSTREELLEPRFRTGTRERSAFDQLGTARVEARRGTCDPPARVPPGGRAPGRGLDHRRGIGAEEPASGDAVTEIGNLILRALPRR